MKCLQTHHLPLRLRRHARVTVHQRLGGLRECVGYTVTETLSQTCSTHTHTHTRTLNKRLFCCTNYLVCVYACALTCFGWTETHTPCAPLSVWCSWPHTRRSYRGTAPGGWCVQAALLNTQPTGHSQSAASLHLAGGGSWWDVGSDSHGSLIFIYTVSSVPGKGPQGTTPYLVHCTECKIINPTLCIK